MAVGPENAITTTDFDAEQLAKKANVVDWSVDVHITVKIKGLESRCVVSVTRFAGEDDVALVRRALDQMARKMDAHWLRHPGEFKD
ncbi:MAG: hypothetical protein WCB68_10655 [Pyrinomonadaceae bacterium]